MTDGLYLSPQPGPNDSAPDSRTLLVAGADSDSSATFVMANGVSVPIKDGGWSVQVPVKGPGLLTLRVSDNENHAITAQFTLIDLTVASPVEGQSLPITPKPAMPALQAIPRIAGYMGGSSAITFDWALDVRGRYRYRCGTGCGRWQDYNRGIGSGSSSGDRPWDPTLRTIEGGFAKLTVSADIPNVLDDPVQGEPRWVDIPGTNPTAGAVKSYIAAHDPHNAVVEEDIFYSRGEQVPPVQQQTSPRGGKNRNGAHRYAPQPGAGTTPLRGATGRYWYRPAGQPPGHVPPGVLELACQRRRRYSGVPPETGTSP